MRVDYNALRQEYRSQQLDEMTVGDDPLRLFQSWLRQAFEAGIQEANAMALATALDGVPAVRMVLLKGCDDGGFVFYTNYESAKGQALAANPVAEAAFYWRELERQVRVHGRVGRVSREESAEYFASRPVGARIGAWASPQSRVVGSRQELEARYAAVAGEYGDGPIPLPDHWGGFRIEPQTIEFWQGRPSRMHDRIRFRRREEEGWERERVAP